MNNGRITCWYNDCTLTDAEREDPDMIDGEPVCESCYNSWRCENESECPFCCNYWLVDDLSVCFVLVDDEFGEPGLYRPLSYPFYSQPLIGAPHLWDHAVQRIGSLLPSTMIDIDRHPAAYVCKECMGGRGGCS